MKKYSILIVVLVVFFGGVHLTLAADIYLSAPNSEVRVGSTLTSVVYVNSSDKTINSAEGVITFPTDILSVESISLGGSIFSIWVEQPSFSNSTGIISFNGGVPNPGFIGNNGSVIRINFKAKKTGIVNLAFTGASVYANDGLGTDVTSGRRGLSIEVVPVQQVEVIQKNPISQPISSVTTLQITSPTHPNQELWYKDSGPIFRWKVPADVDAIQTGIDNNTSGSPRVTYSPAINEKSVKDLKDGIWYFKVRARKDGNWSPISTYITRIDSTPPKNNEVAFSYYDDKKILSISADIIDEVSGLDYYEIYINDSLVKKVASADFVNGNYSIVVNTPGDNRVKLVAVDRAGNSVESLGAFQTTAAPEKILPITSTDRQLLVTIGYLSFSAVYFVIVILLTSLILVIGAFKLGHHYNKAHNRPKMRTILTKGDNAKVLFLLKKRLEKHLEILQRTRHNRVLSKEEKEIKEAIEGDLDEVDKAIEEQEQEQR
jgi:hypothetical protein